LFDFKICGREVPVNCVKIACQRYVSLRELAVNFKRSVGSRVRITAQLIDGATGGHIWAERYDRNLDDIFALQDEISQAIVAAYVDLTEQREHFRQAFLLAALALILLISGAVGIPTIAWYRRTREKQQADRRIRFLAHHDGLTGLANRTQLIEKLEEALAVLPLRGGSLAVHFIDLDHFKEVNDTLGHDAGDFLLKTTAERLRAVTRADDIVARLGGDEFVVVQTEVGGKEQVEDFGRRLIAAVTAPIALKEQEIIATASVGIAVAPADGSNPERLLKSADLALYKSKADGRNCSRFFEPEMDIALRARITLEKLLRDAVINERFVLHYQPLFEISGERLIGFEALIRLPGEDGTLIPPLTFIPVAEDMRLIGKIGAWVLREACQAASTWPEHLTVAVNLSPSQFEAAFASFQAVADSAREVESSELTRICRAAAGVPVAGGMEEALRRMEAGEDPEKIEAEMGDVFDTDPFSALGEKDPGETARGLAALRRRLPRASTPSFTRCDDRAVGRERRYTNGDSSCFEVLP